MADIKTEADKTVAEANVTGGVTVNTVDDSGEETPESGGSTGPKVVAPTAFKELVTLRADYKRAMQHIMEARSAGKPLVKNKSYTKNTGSIHCRWVEHTIRYFSLPLVI